MFPKVSVFIATSLDGFIARPDGNIDWLNQANIVVPKGEDCGYAAFMATVDAIAMGRNTFELQRGNLDRVHPSSASLPSSPSPFSQGGRRGAGLEVPLPPWERDLG